MSTPAFRPAWWLPGPHLPTLWGKFFRQPRDLPLRRERWDTPDDDFLDLVRLDAPASSPDAPRLVLLHGLEGGMRSHYVRGLFDQAARRGWAMDLLIFRSCGDEPNRQARLYHSGETSDAAFVLDRLHREAPARPILATGVSLGGNVLLKLLGERGPDLPAPVAAAATVSVPYDLGRGSRYISRGFARFYERHFLRSLRGKALAKHERYPGIFDPARLTAAETLWAFDDAVTAPVHGFADADDYYTRSSSLHYLSGIRVPTLLVSAVDDPFLPPAVLDEVREVARENAALTLDFVPRGGHVGFVGGAPWRPTYYAEDRVTNFLAAQLATATAAPLAPQGGGGVWSPAT